jgi:hypothetical protein
MSVANVGYPPVTPPQFTKAQVTSINELTTNLQNPILNEGGVGVNLNLPYLQFENVPNVNIPRGFGLAIVGGTVTVASGVNAPDWLEINTNAGDVTSSYNNFLYCMPYGGIGGTNTEYAFNGTVLFRNATNAVTPVSVRVQSQTQTDATLLDFTISFLNFGIGP